MPRKATRTVVEADPVNGEATATVTWTEAEVERATDAINDHLETVEATNPVDDFDPGLNLNRVLKLRGKVLTAKARAESAKAALKETDEYERAKTANEHHKLLEAELNELLAELGREYPLFERRS
jgi:hypothetical protein